MQAHDPTDPVAAHQDDIERLASCLGLMAGEGGEAENAGRAVGTIARRLGLTGGQLKDIFLAGAHLGGSAEGWEAASTLDAEEGGLRRQLRMAEFAHAATQREIATLVEEKNALARTLAESGGSVRRWRVASGVAAVAALALLGTFGLRPHPAASVAQFDRSQADHAADSGPFGRAAVVRSGGTSLFDAPDTASAALVSLPAGTRLVVRRLLWKTLQQWAEVEVGGRAGYVVTTGIELS